MAKKKITREDFAGLRLLRPAEGKRADRMYAQGNDGYNPYGYDPEEYGYIKDGGPLPEVTVYGYYDSGDDGWKWSSGIPPWGDTDNPFIDREYPGDESDIWFEIYGEDYYYYNSPYYDVYDTEVGGSPLEDPRKDGVDVTNPKHFLFEDMKKEPVFYKQLTKILESNSVLKKLLAYFDDGNSCLILKIGNMGDSENETTGATTEYDYVSKRYIITFNEKCIEDDGWHFAPELPGVDMTGFDWRLVETQGQSLAATLIHEALHAKHFVAFNAAYYTVAANSTPDTIVQAVNQEMIRRGYPEDFRRIFSESDESTKWRNDIDKENRMHAYMKDHEIKNFYNAFNEFYDDYGTEF